MNEVVNVIVQKTGVSENVANQAVTAVFGYLERKLPAPIMSQLEPLLTGHPASAPANQNAPNHPRGGLSNKLQA